MVGCRPSQVGAALGRVPWCGSSCVLSDVPMSHRTRTPAHAGANAAPQPFSQANRTRREACTPSVWRLLLPCTAPRLRLAAAAASETRASPGWTCSGVRRCTHWPAAHGMPTWAQPGPRRRRCRAAHLRALAPSRAPLCVFAGSFQPISVRYSGERCCVCDLDSDFDFDQLVCCDLCGLAVHQVRLQVARSLRLQVARSLQVQGGGAAGAVAPSALLRRLAGTPACRASCCVERPPSNPSPLLSCSRAAME